MLKKKLSSAQWCCVLMVSAPRVRFVCLLVFVSVLKDNVPRSQDPGPAQLVMDTPCPRLCPKRLRSLQ